MSAGTMRAIQRTQLLRQTRPLARYSAVRTLSPPVCVRRGQQRRHQSTVAEIHDASRTIPQATGILSGHSAQEVTAVGSLLGATAPMGATGGPIARYEMLIKQGRLREDSHQKGMESSVCKFVGHSLTYSA